MHEPKTATTGFNLPKLFAIFKKGDKSKPKNYRGITVINCLAKLYDMILCARLERWFKPYREQAGAQKGRSCVEHIVTLRLLTDFAKKKKKQTVRGICRFYPGV